MHVNLLEKKSFFLLQLYCYTVFSFPMIDVSSFDAVLESIQSDVF